MVLDDGPWPCGRTTTFTWAADGRTTCSHFYGGDDLRGVPPGFEGVQALAMRDGSVLPFRVFDGASPPAPRLVLDAARWPCTAAGYLAAHGDADAQRLLGLAFDVAGDICGADWDRAATPEGHDALLRLLEPPADPAARRWHAPFAADLAWRVHRGLRRRALDAWLDRLERRQEEREAEVPRTVSSPRPRGP